jgi:MacB-like periplasmic core domain
MRWRRRNRAEDLERELRGHLELEAEERHEAGLSPDEARFAARRAFGNATLIKEDVRAVWNWTLLEQLAQDLRYAARTMRKNWGFSIVAILSLALGIGANTAIFGLIDALLLKSLPVRDPQSLYFLAKQDQHGTHAYFYYETYQRLRAAQLFLQELAAYGERVRMNVSIDGISDSTMGQLVSGNYYSVLGVSPAAGRVFDPEDDRPAIACTIVGETPPREALKLAGVVFRGTVVKSELLPQHPEMRGRKRFAVTLHATEYWKGNRGETLTLYDLEPGTDCMGAGLEVGREYLIFAKEEPTKDYRDSDFFWFGWTDILPAGTPMLWPLATLGGDLSLPVVRTRMRQLGRGKNPTM